MIVTTDTLLKEAKKNGYIVGAFNTVNLETTRAILNAAKETRSPVIVQMTEKTFEYAGGRAIFNLVKNMADFYFSDIPISIHLDHGKSLEVVERAIDMGFPSVMYDGSRHAYADNLRVTKQVALLAHAKGVSVQAEIGNVPYLSEVSGNIDWEDYMTDPDQAVRFVEETGIDTLAIAIGNAHGFTKERDEPDYARLSEIASRLSLPLVLHGASDWEDGRAEKVRSLGISCFNVDTAIRLSFIGALSGMLASGEETEIRKVLGSGMLAVQETVMKKMELFGSAGRA